MKRQHVSKRRSQAGHLHLLGAKGFSRLHPVVHRPYPGIRREQPRDWYRCVVVGGGPSFTEEQAALIMAARPEWRVLVINNGFQRVPTADALYAGDRPWWHEYYPQLRAAGFQGLLWTCNRLVAHRLGLYHVEISDEPGLSFDTARVFSGSNSGYQGINLVRHFGAREIALVGFDMQLTDGRKHWHPDHGGMCDGQLPVATWVPKFDQLAADLFNSGVRVVNCTIKTALTCFEQAPLQEVLCR